MSEESEDRGRGISELAIAELRSHLNKISDQYFRLVSRKPVHTKYGDFWFIPFDGFSDWRIDNARDELYKEIEQIKALIATHKEMQELSRTAEVKPAKPIKRTLRKNQQDKVVVRSYAESEWQKDPNITLRQMVQKILDRPKMLTSREYPPGTIEEWIRELRPQYKPRKGSRRT